MNCWIINPYGNIPGEGWRDYRSTMIARALERSGHNTVWWVSNFIHRSKTWRENGWKDVMVTPNYIVRIVPSTPYKSHISFSRIRYEKNFIKNVCENAKKYNRPDVIILGEPALFVSKRVLKLVKELKVKLVVDFIDLWPELFHMILPVKLSWLGNLLFLHLYRRRANLLKKADGIVAVADDYLEFSRSISSKQHMDVVYWGIDLQKFRIALNTPVQLFEKILLEPKKPGEVWIIYAGTLGNNYDIRSILEASEMLEYDNHLNLRLIIAGEGPLKDFIVSTIKSKGLKKTVFAGSLNPDALTYLYSFCDAALSTYISSSTVSMPIKAFDYFAAGLPVINSLQRDLGKMVINYNLGFQYEAGNVVSLAEEIRKIVLNHDIREQMSKNAYKFAQNFDILIQYEKFVRLIELVVRN